MGFFSWTDIINRDIYSTLKLTIFYQQRYSVFVLLIDSLYFQLRSSVLGVFRFGADYTITTLVQDQFFTKSNGRYARFFYAMRHHVGHYFISAVIGKSLIVCVC